MAALPKSWRAVPLADVVKINPGIDKGQFRDEDQMPFVPMSAVEAETGRIDTSARRPFGKVKSGFTAFALGDVLFAKITPCMENGKMAVVPDLPNGVGFGTTEFHILRPTEAVDTKFLYYFVSSAPLRHEAQHQMTGAVGQKRVPKRYLETKPFPLPPLSEQRRIVEKIETLFTRLDKGEEALREVQKLLARYRRSVLKAAVTGQLTADWRAENAHRLEHGRDLLARILQNRREQWQGRGKYKEPTAPDTSDLPELPEGWVWTTLEHLGFVKSGQTPKGVGTLNDPAGTIPWFKVSSMNEPGNEVELRTSQWMFTEDGARAAGLNLLPPGTIAFPKRGGAILTNKKRRLGCQAALDLNTMGFVPVALGDYVWAFIQGLDLRTIYDGSNVPQINYHDIADVLIALPSSIEEAGVIADLVGTSIDQTARLEDWCKTELARSASLRQSILKDAFRGRLVSQDPSDEPASELLARIRDDAASKPKRARQKVPA